MKDTLNAASPVIEARGVNLVFETEDDADDDIDAGETEESPAEI